MSLNASVNADSENEAGFSGGYAANPEQVVIELHDSEVLSKWLSDALNELSARERLIILKRRLNEKAPPLNSLAGF